VLPVQKVLKKTKKRKEDKQLKWLLMLPGGFLHRIFKSGISWGAVQCWERPIYVCYFPLQSGHPSHQCFNPTIQHQDPASVSWGIVVSNIKNKVIHKI